MVPKMKNSLIDYRPAKMVLTIVSIFLLAFTGWFIGSALLVYSGRGWNQLIKSNRKSR
jgi:hypothetical protein